MGFILLFSIIGILLWIWKQNIILYMSKLRLHTARWNKNCSTCVCNLLCFFYVFFKNFFGPFWCFMLLHGTWWFVLVLLKLLGIFWYFNCDFLYFMVVFVLFGTFWCIMIFLVDYGSLWYSMVFYGIFLVLYGFYGTLLYCMVLYGTFSTWNKMFQGLKLWQN